MNKTIGKKCEDFREHNGYKVEFIGAYKIFLERFKFYDEKKRGMSTRIRVIRPLDKFFQTDERPLNAWGCNKLYNFILQSVDRPFEGELWGNLLTVLEHLRETDERDPLCEIRRGQLPFAVLHEVGFKEEQDFALVPLSIKPYFRKMRYDNFCRQVPVQGKATYYPPGTWRGGYECAKARRGCGADKQISTQSHGQRGNVQQENCISSTVSTPSVHGFHSKQGAMKRSSHLREMAAST